MAKSHPEDILDILESMRFTRDTSTAPYLPRAYRPGEITINETLYRTPVIISASALEAGPAIVDAASLLESHAAPLLALDPEVVLLGTGAQHTFPPAVFGAQFLKKGIGFEAMGTAAACRTFNVLVSEQRRVVALLLP
jgi:uncharacterized protein